MNFTTLDHIREIINDGAIYWTLRDRNNSAILAEQTVAISANDSYDKLTRNIKEMRGDFVKLSLSARNPAEKNAGGNVKSYGPFNIEIQNAGNTAAVINGPPQFNIAGPSWQEHIILMRDNERLAYRCTDLERQIKEAENGKIEKIAGYFAPLLDRILPEQQIKQVSAQVGATPYTFSVADQETFNNLSIVANYPNFTYVLKYLADKGPDFWNGLIEQLKNVENANV
jgi:hypothetical protein